MKTKKILQGLVIGALALFFIGCSNLFNNSKNENSSLEQGKFVITLGLNKPGARLIHAFEYSISKVEIWNLTLTNESGNEISLKTGETNGTNVSSASYDSEKETITATLIPEGTYKVELEGTYTESETTYTVYGSTSGVSISANSTGTTSILVGPKTTEDGKGAISVTFTDSNQSLSTLGSSLKAKLTKISSSNTYYTTDSTDTEATGSLTFNSSDNTYTLSGENILSGWYKISFSVDNTYRVYLPDNPDKFIEIVDNITTTSKANIAAEKGKAYYATNESSSYNGLAASSRINLKTLFDNFEKNMPAEGNIYIYVDDIPEIDIASFNSLKTSVAAEKKSIFIYNAEKEEVLSIGDGEGNSTIALKDSLILSASTDNTNLSVDSIDLTADTTITLKNGATIDLSSISESDFKLGYTINIYAVDSTGETDNLSAYNTTAFITTKENDISSYISLYKYGETEVTEKYVVVYADGKHYIKLAGNGEITAESFAEKVSISAKYSIDASTTYENTSVIPSATIPYNNDTLTFSLSGLDDYNLDDDAFAWYLNGETSLGSGNKISFIPYEQSELNIDDSNAIVCYVTINGTTYARSMSFTFSAARSAAVWYDGVNATSTLNTKKFYSLVQLADNTDTTANASELISNLTSSPIYCFDKNFNLWTAVSGDTGLVLTKYSMILSSGLYNTTGTSTTYESITATPIDMTYDATTEYFYILEENEDDSYTLHKILPFVTYSAYTYANGTLSITDSGNNTITPSQIAVCGDIIYVAGSDCNIYAGAGVGTDSMGTLELTFDSSKTTTLASENILSGYNSENEADYLSITDLQIGDGSGNDTSSLYALVREYSDGYSGKLDMVNDIDSIYSRGALVKISISESEGLLDSISYESSYGWTTNTTSVTDTYNNTGNLYAPDSSSTTVEFYGPSHFAAVVPKKLVILDDGIAATGKQGTLNNKDSLVEFDIEESSLSRGASVGATTPTTSVSYFTVS